jgi:hypothetical protein
MAHAIFDMQAALLYDANPELDADRLIDQLNALARAHALSGSFKILRGLTGGNVVALAGCGVHASLSWRDTPLPQENFSLQLSAPINRMKAIDFEALIASHRAAIVINVGDGETLIPVDARRQMAEMGVGQGSDPLVKATVLHLLIQGLARMRAPLITDFLPSQLLLAPVELEAVADMGLPIPILFHPYPVDGGPDASGRARFGLQAIHSQVLIGKQIELEAVPDGVDTALMINLLASLIIEHRKGALPLNHGDVLQESSEDMAIYIRHEAPLSEGEPMRVIVSFDTRASGPAPTAPKPLPPAPPQIDAAQQAFQDRVARLKSKGQPETAPATPQPVDEKKPAAAQARPTTGLFKSMDLPVSAHTIKIGAAGLLVAGLYVFNPGAILQQKFEAELAAQPSFQDSFGSATTALGRQPGDTRPMNTMNALTLENVPDLARPQPTLAAAPADPAPQTTVIRVEAAGGPNGQFIVSGRDQQGNPVVFTREIKDDADRDQIVRDIVGGTLRSEIMRQLD